ncbi:hypothetical protein Tco_0537478 [Tanacetum coccineum]
MKHTLHSRGKTNNLGPSILQKAILDVEISLGRCGIANLAILQLENVSGRRGRSKISYWRMSNVTKKKNPRAFVGGTWSDNSEDEEDKTNEETCLVAQASNEICLGINLEANEWIKDSGCRYV